MKRSRRADGNRDYIYRTSLSTKQGGGEKGCRERQARFGSSRLAAARSGCIHDIGSDGRVIAKLPHPPPLAETLWTIQSPAFCCCFETVGVLRERIMATGRATILGDPLGLATESLDDAIHAYASEHPMPLGSGWLWAADCSRPCVLTRSSHPSTLIHFPPSFRKSLGGSTPSGTAWHVNVDDGNGGRSIKFPIASLVTQNEFASLPGATFIGIGRYTQKDWQDTHASHGLRAKFEFGEKPGEEERWRRRVAKPSRNTTVDGPMGAMATLVVRRAEHGVGDVVWAGGVHTVPTTNHAPIRLLASHFESILHCGPLGLDRDSEPPVAMEVDEDARLSELGRRPDLLCLTCRGCDLSVDHTLL
ncbi:hypothetical protein CIHG_00603 [Coccidioides immitis H538.4]|uniref:Uncharacterized protein n=1 Tax=Coccidioides immitis H538.4 TaxID=396776 RepID=A0A0J8RC91_COCIT|nr:hypothetical protein CIHG_00603 [Coccidioides immitis H538.4]